MGKQGSLLALWLGLVVCGTGTPAAAQNFVDLDEVRRRVGDRFGPIDESVVGFLSLAQRFAGPGAAAVFENVLGTPVNVPSGVPEFGVFIDEAQSVIDTVPIPSGSTSVAYTYDPTLETFVPWERPLAPAISQNAITNGRGVLTLGVSYSYLDFDRFNDSDHDNVIVATSPLIEVPGVADIRNVLYFNFKLRQQVWAFAFQYGILDDLDLGVFVPVIDLDFRGKAIDRPILTTRRLTLPDGTVIEDGTTLYVTPQGEVRQRDSVDALRQADFTDLPYDGIRHSERETNIGDVVVRAKYHAASIGPADLGLVLGASLPTGDEDNLFGVGNVRFDPRLLVSHAGPRVAFHFNGGYHADVEETNRDRFDYGAGGEVRVASWMTLLVDQIGRIGIRGPVQVRKFEVVPGVKINPWRDLVLGVNAIVPLNREGLTTEWTPNATAEISFRM